MTAAGPSEADTVWVAVGCGLGVDVDLAKGVAEGVGGTGVGGGVLDGKAVEAGVGSGVAVLSSSATCSTCSTCSNVGVGPTG